MITTSISSHIKYRSDIDGLRALAVISVIIGHYFPQVLPGGFVGVDIFFVISGFLITSNILRDIARSRFSFLAFYAARIKRIMPALFVTMVGTFLLGYLVLDQSEIIELVKEAISGSLYFLNFHMVESSGYFDLASRLKPFLHLWSLSLEEQFYLVLPLLIYLIAAKKINNLLLFFIFFSALSFLINLLFTHTHPVASYYLLPTRFWEFLIGGVVGYLHFSGVPENNIAFRIGLYFELTLLVLLGALMVFWNGNFTFPGWWALIPVATSASIIFLGNNSAVNNKFFELSFLRYIGRISYPLYLWHWPLLAILTISNNGRVISLPIRLTCILVAILFAVLTYHFIEQPIRTNKKLSLRFIFAAGFSCVAVIISLSGWVLINKGLPSRNVVNYPIVTKAQVDRNLGVARWDQLNLSLDQNCIHSNYVGSKSVDYCRLTSERPSLAIIGDSHANHLVPGLQALARKPYSDLVQISYGGCDYLGNFVVFNKTNIRLVPDCYIANRKFIDLIVADKNLEVVFLSYANVNLFNSQLGTYNPSKNIKLDSPESNEGIFNQTVTSLSNLIGTLSASGKKVIFLIDIPHMPFELKDCLYERKLDFSTHAAEKCNVKLDNVLRDQSNMRMLARELKKKNPSLHVIDLPNLLCTNGVCPLVKDGKLLYKDNDHLSLDGSLLVGQFIKMDLEGELSGK